MKQSNEERRYQVKRLLADDRGEGVFKLVINVLIGTVICSLIVSSGGQLGAFAGNIVNGAISGVRTFASTVKLTP